MMESFMSREWKRKLFIFFPGDQSQSNYVKKKKKKGREEREFECISENYIFSPPLMSSESHE